MANRFLPQFYQKLYNEPFDYSDFSKRLKMQKGIYLLQEMGVPVGDYRFSWYKHGPYSQALLDDMHSANVSESAAYQIRFSSDTESAIKHLAATLIVPNGVAYSSEQWAECLGSLHYLSKVIQSSASSDELISLLMKRKPHLNDVLANKKALEKVQELQNY